MLSTAQCRRTAEEYAAKARDERAPASSRIVFQHLADSWLVCAEAKAVLEAFDRRERQPAPARKQATR